MTVIIPPATNLARLRILGISILAITALVLGLLPATAAQAAGRRMAAGSYVLTIANEAGQQRAVTLECKPTGGTHPRKRKACRQLVQTDGQIYRIPATAAVCTREYAPVTVKAEGTWYGTHYEHKETFDNRCLAITATGGHLFNF